MAEVGDPQVQRAVQRVGSAVGQFQIGVQNVLRSWNDVRWYSVLNSAQSVIVARQLRRIRRDADQCQSGGCGPARHVDGGQFELVLTRAIVTCVKKAPVASSASTGAPSIITVAKGTV
jgi:hypothetical protein